MLAALAALRLPSIWAHGRFQDEEATVFLAYAWHFPATDALFRTFAGYLNLAANAATLALATLVKSGIINMEQAPYFTMLLGLSFQMVPILLVLTGSAPWLRSRGMRLACALFIALTPGSDEVIANVIHIQFHLALSVAIILTLDVPQSWITRRLYALPLMLAPLCGPAAILLLPLFILRALLDQDAERWWQSIVLGLGSVVQLAIFYEDSPIRGTRPDLFTAAAGTLLRLVFLPLLGSGMSDQLALRLTLSQQSGLGLTLILAASSLLLFGSFLFFAMRRRSSSTWLLLACLAIAVPCFAFGLATSYRTFVLFPSAGPRYNYIPLLLLGFAVMSRIPEVSGVWRTILFGAAAMGFTTAAVPYVRPSVDAAGRPIWPAEVARWRADPDYSLRVWGTERLVDLSGRARPCRPPRSPSGDMDAPVYCEAGWMVDFWAAGSSEPSGQASTPK